MLDADAIERNLARAVTLVVVSSLEVGRRALDATGAQRLRLSTINSDTQHTLLVLQLIAELLANLDLANLGHLQAADIRDLADTNGQGTRLVNEELGDWLLGHLVVDFDLADDGAVLGVVSGNDVEFGLEAVGAGTRVPRLRRGFTQLGAAVLAVGRSDAARAAARPGDLHDDGAVLLVGEEVLRVRPSLATFELVARDLVYFAAAAGRELEAEFGEVQVAAGRAGGVQGAGEESVGGDGCWSGSSQAEEEDQCGLSGGVHFGGRSMWTRVCFGLRRNVRMKKKRMTINECVWKRKQLL